MIKGITETEERIVQDILKPYRDDFDFFITAQE